MGATSVQCANLNAMDSDDEKARKLRLFNLPKRRSDALLRSDQCKSALLAELAQPLTFYELHRKLREPFEKHYSRNSDLPFRPKFLRQLLDEMREANLIYVVLSNDGQARFTVNTDAHEYSWLIWRSRQPRTRLLTYRQLRRQETDMAARLFSFRMAALRRFLGSMNRWNLSENDAT